MTSKNSAFRKEALGVSPLPPAAPPRFSLFIYRHAVDITNQTETRKSSSKCLDFPVRRLPGLHAAPSAVFCIIIIITDTFLQTFRILLANCSNSPHFNMGQRRQIQIPLFFEKRNFHSSGGELIRCSVLKTFSSSAFPAIVRFQSPFLRKIAIESSSPCP